MKILLINPPIREDEPPRHIPFGLATIASVLREEGHTVEMLDINAYRYSESEIEAKLTVNDRYDIIATGGLITLYKYLKWLVPKIRQHNPKTPIVLGGGVVSTHPKLLLSNTPADVAVIGEGEVTMSELASQIEAGKKIQAVKGIAYKPKKGQIKVNPPRPLISNLDDIPFPAYDLFPMDIYLNNVGHADAILKSTELSLITCRGCPYSCHFCYGLFGCARNRSIDNVIAEIQLLQDKYNPETYLILDEIFTTSRKRVKEFHEKTKKEGLDLTFSCYGRVNIINSEILTTLKKSGCYSIGYGIESGSQKILDNMNKRVTVEQAKKAIKLTRKHHLMPRTTFMIGYPGETEETLKETITFCRELNLSPGFFITTAYPGTQLYQDHEKEILAQYGSLDAYFSVLGDATYLTFNFTDFSDEKLLELRTEMQQKLRKRRSLENIYHNLRIYGPTLLARKYLRRIRAS